MDSIGNHSLFTNHFVIGCREMSRDFTKTETDEIKILQDWVYFKNNDWVMQRYNIKYTQYISLPVIIAIEDLKEIIQDLYNIYIKENEYSELLDFIEDCFGYSIFHLKKLIEYRFNFIGQAPVKNSYCFYTSYLKMNREYIDLGISENKELGYYIQYWKKVLKVITDFKPDIVPLNKEVNILTDIRETDSTKPFVTKEIENKFYYALKKWEYDKDLKYAYIYNCLVDTLDYPIVQADYERFVRQKYNISRVHFNLAKSFKRINQIEQILKNYKN